MKKIYTLMALTVALFAGSAALQSCSDDDDSPATTVPKAYVQALKAQYPEAANVQWDKNGAYYVAEFAFNTNDYDVWFDNNAEWAMTEIDYGRDLFMVPDNAVTTAFATGDYSRWTVDEIDYYKTASMAFYVFEVSMPGMNDMHLYYTADGTLARTVTASADAAVLPNDTL